MQINNIMLDIETLDTKESSVVLSIGAVKFDKNGTHDCTHLILDLDVQMQYGRTISPSTIMWWMRQSDAARSAFDRPQQDLREALLEFSNFFDHGEYKVWGNGAMFDNSIIKHLMTQFGFPIPWKYNKDRCYRTVLAEHKESHPNFEVVKPIVAHDAVEDAIAQARTLIHVWENDIVS